MSKELNILFGNNLRERRKELRLTQAEVASKLGISTSFYANIERGNRFVSLEVLAGLAKALNVSIGSFFEEHKSNATLDNINEMLQIFSQEELLTVERILEAMLVSFTYSRKSNDVDKD